MTGSNLNDIAGERVNGASEFENGTLRDVSDLICRFAQAIPDPLDATPDQARGAGQFFSCYAAETIGQTGDISGFVRDSIRRVGAEIHRLVAFCRASKCEGAELLWGGRRLDMPTEGHDMCPVIFVGSRNDIRINPDEMFAPLTCAIREASYGDGLHVKNDTNFGLTAGIVTTHVARAAHSTSRRGNNCDAHR